MRQCYRVLLRIRLKVTPRLFLDLFTNEYLELSGFHLDVHFRLLTCI